ncbi:PAAR domain-containing protein [Collimonas pratensis]|nr:PAAR domain-containing protein [Collimonas pratensis]
MVMRKVVVVGDKTTTSGTILPNANSTFSVGDADHKVALIGGQATCLACKGVGTIAKAGGPRRMNFMGEVALEDDIVICGCPIHPKLVANLHHTTTFDDGAASHAASSPGAEAVKPAESSSAATASQSASFDEMPHAKVDGQGLAEHPYFVETEDGRTFSGVTDSEGKIPRISTASEGQYKVHWGDDALAKQAEKE